MRTTSLLTRPACSPERSGVRCTRANLLSVSLALAALAILMSAPAARGDPVPVWPWWVGYLKSNLPPFVITLPPNVVYTGPTLTNQSANGYSPLDGVAFQVKNKPETFSMNSMVQSMFYQPNPSALPPEKSWTTESGQSFAQIQFKMYGGPPETAYVPVTFSMGITNVGTTNSYTYYDTEMTLTGGGGGGGGGTLPSYVAFRTDPNHPSRGKTVVWPLTNGVPGFGLQSFFDVCLELSTDGGLTFTNPYPLPVRMAMGPINSRTTPTQEFPPEGSAFVSALPSAVSPMSLTNPVVHFGNGAAIRNLVLTNLYTGFYPPPTGGGDYYNSTASASFEYNLDGSTNFVAASNCVASLDVHFNKVFDEDACQLWETEMTELDISGGTLPSGLVLRAQTGAPSAGTHAIVTSDDGQYEVSSFFDVFVEISLDNGMSFSPAAQPLYVELGTVSAATLVHQYCPAANSVNITIGHAGRVYYATVKVDLPDWCTFVTSWGVANRANNAFSVQGATFAQLSGMFMCNPVIHSVQNTYWLGLLAPGQYTFTFNCCGQALKQVAFTIFPPGPMLISKITPSSLVVKFAPDAPVYLEQSSDLSVWMPVYTNTDLWLSNLVEYPVSPVLNKSFYRLRSVSSEEEY